jgi:hypothetical protein
VVTFALGDDQLAQVLDDLRAVVLLGSAEIRVAQAELLGREHI